MPLPDRNGCKYVDTTTRSPSIATMDHFLRGSESSRMSPTYSPTSSSSPSSPYFDRLKHHDMEEDQAMMYQRKSVLAKVKEKARKLRYSLSKKRQEEEEANFTPSWGVSLEDEEEEVEDAEYLGAPIYESELAPEEYKENARQHPRANPVISEKRVLKTNLKSGVEQDQENSLSPIKSTTTTQPAIATATTTTNAPNMTMNETLAQKITPSNAEGYSNAAHFTSSKTDYLASKTPSAKISSPTSSVTPPTSPYPSSPIQNASSLFNPMSGKNTMSSNNVTTNQAISPRRSASNNNGSVIDRVRGAVTSLLRNEESSSSSQQKYAAVKTPTTRASPHINNAQEVAQEQNHGRILQAN